MKKQIEFIRNLAKELNLSDGLCDDEHLYTPALANLFFFNGNMGRNDLATCFVDGKGDGGIDFLYSDQEVLYLLQGKSSEHLSPEDVFNAFRKMKDTVEELERKDYSNVNDKLSDAFREAYSEIGENKEISLVLFTNTEFSEDFYSRFDLFKNKDEYSRFELLIYDKSTIESKLADKSAGTNLVKEDTLRLYNKQSKALTYAGDMGAIVNASASEIQRLYKKYGNEKKIKTRDQQLFSFNLREHINSNKDVDDAISRTIQKEPDKFWFYNNGITIGCNDFEIDGYVVRLREFSIINGAQTTTRIGEAKIPEGRDFAVVCKLIKSPKNMNDEFISKISEASNSQKPISYRDIKSNHPEQKNLQRICGEEESKFRLSIEIKRGRRSQFYKKVQTWERVTNEQLGQLILSCLLQQPGPAKTSKATIFTNQSRYKAIFRRKHDTKTLHDLVQLSNIYDTYKEKETKEMAQSSDHQYEETERNFINGILKNGKFAILAVVLYLLKKQKGLCKNCDDTSLQADNITGELIQFYPNDDLNENLYQLFGFIVREIKNCYLTNKDILNVTSFSNFFKTDENYKRILRRFDRMDKYDKDKVGNFMKVFTYRN